MPSIKQVGTKIRYSADRLDGGYNVKDSPSRIAYNESPDCLNVTFDRRGAVQTRNGSLYLNTTPVSTSIVDGAISYNNTMVIWAGGQMYYASGPSGTTFVQVTAASGKFSSGVTVAAVVYQNVLFCSDGTNGPWKYTGAQAFYNMGIDIPSTVNAASTVTSTTNIAAGTYYYGVSFVNTQVVEGQIGTISSATTLAATASIQLSNIPVGSALAGVNQRFIYRGESASGPFRKVGTLADNTTTSFTDTTANGSEGKSPVLDGSKPTPFNTIALHKELLFYDDNSNRSLVRWTNYTNPFISIAENFEPINHGDGDNIVAIAAQDDWVTIFKNNNTFVLGLTDPSDFLTWVKQQVPANLGIVGAKAHAKMPNGIIFIGQRAGKITGVHYLSGLNVVDSGDGRLRSQTISDKIEYDFLNNINNGQSARIASTIYNQRLYVAYPSLSSAFNDRIFWLDLTRIGTEGQPGSWAPWSGITANQLFNHNGLLFCGDSTATGKVNQLEISETYNDNGTAINSYFWTKEIGGEDEGVLEAYVKDIRDLHIWYAQLGRYPMTVRVRIDGDSGVGTAYLVNLYTGVGTGIWGTMIWGSGTWGTDRVDIEKRIPVGRLTGKKVQVGFDNQNTINQGFRVHRVELDFNIRRRRDNGAVV